MSAPDFSTDDASDKTVNKCSPICQLFINTKDRHSVYTLTNFPSLFSPETAEPCVYKITLTNAEGVEVEATELSVPPFGTAEFVPAKHFSGKLPELGLVSVELVNMAAPVYEHLGLLRPYFYAMYHDKDMKSVSVVHPQTTFVENIPTRKPWRSSLVISTAEIDALEIYQLNPVGEEQEASISICNLKGDVQVESGATMPARSVRRIDWPVSDFNNTPHVVVATEAMTAPNAKPLVFQQRNNGFSASHS